MDKPPIIAVVAYFRSLHGDLHDHYQMTCASICFHKVAIKPSNTGMKLVKKELGRLEKPLDIFFFLSGLIFARVKIFGPQIFEFLHGLNFASDQFFKISRGLHKLYINVQFAKCAKIISMKNVFKHTESFKYNSSYTSIAIFINTSIY